MTPIQFILTKRDHVIQSAMLNSAKTAWSQHLEFYLTVKVLFLTRYGRLGASSRVRALQYIPGFEALGWECNVSALFSDHYVTQLYSGRSRLGEILSGYLRRAKTLFTARKYDLLWIEKELFPFMPPFAEALLNNWGIPYVVDYDDALFHRYDQHSSSLIRRMLGKKIDTVMRRAATVIAGNRYLAAHAEAAGAEIVEIVPTVVDQEMYKVRPSSDEVVTLGWIGSASTAQYLRLIEKPLAKIQQEFGVNVRLIGSGTVDLPSLKYEVLPWEESKEPALVASIDIGIMPLPDSPWERGKCGYKLIQYMACGRPVVASPVGVNSEIVRPGENGFLATSDEQWEESLRILVTDAALRQRMGTQGRQLVEQTYSIQAQAPHVADIFIRARRN